MAMPSKMVWVSYKSLKNDWKGKVHNLAFYCLFLGTLTWCVSSSTFSYHRYSRQEVFPAQHRNIWFREMSSVNSQQPIEALLGVMHIRVEASAQAGSWTGGQQLPPLVAGWLIIAKHKSCVNPRAKRMESAVLNILPCISSQGHVHSFPTYQPNNNITSSSSANSNYIYNHPPISLPLQCRKTVSVSVKKIKRKT